MTSSIYDNPLGSPSFLRPAINSSPQLDPDQPTQHLLCRYQRGERQFGGIDIRGSRLRGVTLTAAIFAEAKLSWADLWGSQLMDSNFCQAELVGTQLGEANLSGSLLWGANLSQANLWGATLRGSQAWGAKLRGANLSHACVKGVDFYKADLTGANLRGTDLSCTRLAQALLVDITFDAQTRFPEGFYLG